MGYLDSCVEAAAKAHQFQPATPTHVQERIGLRFDPQVYPCEYVSTHRCLTTHGLLTLFSNVDDQLSEHSRSSGMCASAFSRITRQKGDINSPFAGSACAGRKVSLNDVVSLRAAQGNHIKRSALPQAMIIQLYQIDLDMSHAAGRSRASACDL